jgi:diaminopimelate epimerase
MEIFYTKMQGAGNDFIVIDNRTYKFSAEQLAKLAAQICQRKFSIGGDALMAVDYPEGTGDFRMRFYNADGTEAEMCGNGARCIARYAYEKKIASEAMVIETVAGPVPAWRLGQQQYKVTLNPPTVEKFDLDFEDENVSGIDYIELGDPGIPHAVVNYPKLPETSLEELTDLAQRIRHWSAFPKGANVNFYAVDSAGELIVRTYERGVEGFTYACGTGSGATAHVVAKRSGQSNEQLVLHVLGGELEVEVSDELQLIGDAIFVSEGKILDEKLVLDKTIISN